MTPRKVLAAAATALVLVTPTVAPAANWGAYLAASHADRTNDFRAAARHYSQALVQDPRNTDLLERAVAAYASLGEIDKAVPIARRLIQVGGEGQIANLVLFSDAAARGAWDAILEDLDAGQTVGPLFDSLLRAWAELGAGRMTEASAAFDEIIDGVAVKPFGLFHKALALATVGDFEQADAILSGEAAGEFRLTARAVLAHAEVLSNLERNDEALALLDRAFGSDADPAVDALRTQLEAGETLPLSVVTDARRRGGRDLLLAGQRPEWRGGGRLHADLCAPGHASAAGPYRGGPDGRRRCWSNSSATNWRPRSIAWCRGMIRRSTRPNSAAPPHCRAKARSTPRSRSCAVLPRPTPTCRSVHVALGDALRHEERFAEAAESL